MTRTRTSLAAAMVSPLLVLALMMLASPAAAKRGISTPMARASADTLPLLPGGLPSPEYASQLSARSTLHPVAFGSGLIALGFTAGNEAGLWSVLGGGIIGSLGILFGPVAGYSYGKVGDRGRMGVVLRTVLIVGVPLEAAQMRRNTYDDDDFYDFLILTLSGAGLASVSAVWDINHVGRHVEAHNRALAAPTSLRLEPCLTPRTGQPGLALRLSF